MANDEIEIYLTASDEVEAAQACVDRLKVLAVERGARGFTLPELLHEDVLRDGEGWVRAFNFRAEFLPGVN